MNPNLPARAVQFKIAAKVFVIEFLR